MSVLQLDAVTRIYGAGASEVRALDDVTLTVDEGDFVAIMGPSGSGKSTLLAIAGGLDQGWTGSVTVAGHPLQGLKRDALARLRRRHVGYVFQDYNLVPTLNVIENVALPLELDRTDPSWARQSARAALKRLGIADLAGRRLDQISGGQRQRVAIARAIVGDRKLVLADEPTGALDSATGDDVMQRLRLLADDGVAVVLVTHEARHAGWADRIVFLRDGRVVDSTRVANDPAVLLAGA
ncbi:ABC transporter ATP-binding protein [Propioniciclava tarda]|uniref:ABC transporter ATP-binding protein n=1 Tax=Propioniciclava tarda TaxID=433330 RepID=A0A4Q9KIK6_PROTD|nr:ABC transporter ATP-binding protein [Propioniciclava tarda]TBT94226.1 ABC transporter ATP-binding protein [Propioniciclava tarda]SMO75166.1 putative ABC transport system ATP-binding protein [Propioniciclava tarda]HQD22394.1 ABC transporter ATP-binding protein [Arachnia sp.]